MALPLFQPIRFKFDSFDIKLWNCGLVVESFGDFFDDQYYLACCSNAFNLRTRVTVQNLTFVPFMVLIDTSYKSTQVIIVQLEQFTQTKCLFIGRNCSTSFSQTDSRLSGGNQSNWQNFSNKLSLYPGNLIYLIQFLRQSVLFSEGKMIF